MTHLPAFPPRRRGHSPGPGTLRVASLATLLLALALTARAEPPAVEIHRPRHRPAVELVSMAQAALGGEGTATADPATNSLVLVGSRAAVDRALALVKAQDRARPTVVVHWRARDQAELAAAGVEVDWGLRTGSLRVGTVVYPENRVGVEARVLRTERERRLEGTLRLLDGEVGEIAQGRSVPVTTRDAWGASATAFVEARQGFRVRPRVLGNGRVRIEIDPMDAQVDAAGRTRFAGASTTVEVRPGEEMVIGSLGERRDAGERGLRVLSTDRRGEERVLLLRVEVEPEP